jgi:adenylate cyclase
VRLVKTIGDAAMLVANEPEPLINAMIELVGRADEARQGFPQLRAGVSYGPALGRAGDWYGRPVNVASRVTGVARPGSVLATAEAKDKAEDAFQWSFAGKRKLKNVTGEQPLFRARRRASD